MIGRTLSHFKITAKLGEGGMGEVYRAEDTKLGREVAVKVLPSEFTADADRLARFAREARVLAALNHPNIAAIYEVGEAEDSIHYLVMELAPGETLAERIARGPIPLEEALEMAGQIAEGLETAHEQGIIHRDLKPANVKVAADGQIKILDFGLAKAMEEPGAADPAGLSMSPTLAVGMTAPQTLLGTAAYMSPEQARGKPLDRRTDIWAFGVLLVEMLTGESPFAGETASDALAAVLTREVDLDDLPDGTPPHIRWLLERCVERDPRLRLRDVGEARVCLSTGSFPTPAAERVETARRRRPGLVAAVFAATAGIVGLWLGLRMAPGLTPPSLRKVDIVLPEQLLFFQAPPLLAPDASAVLLGGESGLYVRRLDRVENRLLPGTAGVLYSTWAPDSREIAFVTPGKLWRATLDGQSPVSIAKLPGELKGGGGIVWTRDDRIFLTGSAASGVMEVSARGGTVEEAVPLDPKTERDFHEISILPETRGFLVSVHPQGRIPSRIDVLSEGGRRTVLEVEDGWVENPVYAPPGYILFSRGSAATPELWAVPFSLASLRATGDPFLVAPTGSSPSVADDGTLSYVRGHRVILRQPLRLDAEGRIERELARPLAGAHYPAMSPDGTRLVASVVDTETYDLMLFDVGTRTATRLTSGFGVELTPAWSPDGARIAYSIADQDQIAVLTVDRPDESRTLTAGFAPRWLPDGESFVFERVGEDASRDVWRHWPGRESEEPLIASPANERWPIVSADGRWLAYTSDEMGQDEVFVRAFPDGERVQVTRRGATEPQWTSSGGLMFRSGSSLYRLRRIDPERLFFEEPELLLSLTDAGFSTGDGAYAATPDGGLVVFRNVISKDPAVLTLVTDWSSEFGEERRP